MYINLKQELENIIKKMKKINDQRIKDLLYLKGKEITYILNAQEMISNEIKKLFKINEGRCYLCNSEIDKKRSLPLCNGCEMAFELSRVSRDCKDICVNCNVFNDCIERIKRDMR